MLALALRGPDMMATVIGILGRPVVSFEDLKCDAVPVPVGTLTVPVASIEHLIATKTGTGRSKETVACPRFYCGDAAASSRRIRYENQAYPRLS